MLTKKTKLVLLILFSIGTVFLTAKLTMAQAPTPSLTAQQITTGRTQTAALEQSRKTANLSLVDKLLVFLKLRDLKSIKKPSSTPVIMPIVNLTDQTILAKRTVVTGAKSIDNGDYLIEDNSNFQIVYAPDPDAFFGIILKRPINTNITNIRNWFIGKLGLQKGEINSCT